MLIAITASEDEFRYLLEDLNKYEIAHEHGVIFDQIERHLRYKGRKKLDEFL